MPSLRKRNVVKVDGERDDSKENSFGSSSSDENSDERFLAVDPEHVDDEGDGKKKKATTAMVVLKSDNAIQINKKKSLTQLIDSFLSSFVEYVSTASGQDACLNVLQWSLFVIPKLLLRNKSGMNKIRKEGFLKFYGVISDARYCLRLLGLPGSIQSVLSPSGCDPTLNKHNQRRIDVLGKIMGWSMVFFHPAEHLAFVKWKSPQLCSHRINAEKCSAYSCRAWLVYIVAEVIQSIIKVKELQATRLRQQQHLTLPPTVKRSNVGDGEKDEQAGASRTNYNDHDDNEDSAATGLVELDKSIEQEKLQILRNLCFTLPCINWGLPKFDTDPWLREDVAESLMWVESIVRIYKNIRAAM